MLDKAMTAGDRGRRMLRESGYARGGHVHEDEAEDKALIKKALAKAKITTKAGGGAVKGKAPSERPDRRARGGATKGNGAGKVNIVIVHGGKGDDAGHGPGGSMGAPPMAPPPMMAPKPPMAGPPPGAMPPHAMPGGPPMAPPGMGPPGGGGMPPPGMMPHKRGGHVDHHANGRFAGGRV